MVQEFDLSEILQESVESLSKEQKLQEVSTVPLPPIDAGSPI